MEEMKFALTGSLGRARCLARREWQNCSLIRNKLARTTPSHLTFTMTKAHEIGSPQIRHKCGFPATIFTASLRENATERSFQPDWCR
jgi:hypothetical protein